MTADTACTWSWVPGENLTQLSLLSVQLPLLLLQSAPFCQVFPRLASKSTLADGSNKICKPVISHTVDFNTTSLLLAPMVEINIQSSCVPAAWTWPLLLSLPWLSSGHLLKSQRLTAFSSTVSTVVKVPQNSQEKVWKAFSAIRFFHTSWNKRLVSQKGKVPLLCQERSSAAALLTLLPFILSDLRWK